MAKAFPLNRFLEAGVAPATIAQLQAAWALLSPTVQEAENAYLAGVDNLTVANITSFPVSGGAVPAASGPGGQIIEVNESSGSGSLAIGSPVTGATDGALLGVDSSGNLVSGPTTQSVKNVASAVYVVDTYQSAGTDDQACQAAINAAAAAITASTIYGAVIKFLPRVYNWTTAPPQIPVNLTGRITFQGSGIDETEIVASTNAPRFLDFATASVNQNLQNVEITDLTFNDNNIYNASDDGTHVLIGNAAPSSTNTVQVNVQDITVRRVRVTNIPLGTTAQVGRRAVFFNVSQANNLPQNNIQRILVEDFEVYGGSYLVGLYGTGSPTQANNVFHDDIVIRRWRHYMPTVPTAFSAADHIQVGAHGWGHRLLIEDGYANNSSDCGIELNSMTDITVRDCTIDDSLTAGVLVNNFNPNPASAPVQTTISNGGAGTAVGATVIPITTSTPANSGAFTVGSWVNIVDSTHPEAALITAVSATSITVTTGNSATDTNPGLAYAHADGIWIVQWGDTTQQRILLDNVRSRRINNTTGGRGFQINISGGGNPMGEIIMQNCSWLRTTTDYGSSGSDAEAIKMGSAFVGAVPRIFRLIGFTSNVNNINSATTSGLAQMIYLIGTSPFETLIAMRDVTLSVAGSYTGTAQGTSMFSIGVQNAILNMDNVTATVNLPTGGAWTIFNIAPSGLASKFGGIRGRIARAVIRNSSDGTALTHATTIRQNGSYANASAGSARVSNGGSSLAAGTTVIPVTSTTPFTVGQKVIIDPMTTSAEVGIITAINAGVSLTMAFGISSTAGTALSHADAVYLMPMGELVFEDCDFTGITASAAFSNIVNTTGTGSQYVMAPITFRNVAFPVGALPAASTMTVPATTVAGAIVDGFEGLLSISGGTVTSVQVGRSPSTLFQVAASSPCSFSVNPGDYIAITYSAAPTVKKIPVLR